MDSPHDLLILYASQTGTAQYFAENLFRLCFSKGLSPRLFSIEQYPLESLPSENYIIFIVSTTGQGEPPLTMQAFWHFLLLKDLPKDVLCDVKFTVFGLGDRVYQQFNAMARKLYQRLLQLGAQEFHPKALGDESNALGHYAEWEPWCKALWESLQREFPGKKVISVTNGENNHEKGEEIMDPPRFLVRKFGGDRKDIEIDKDFKGPVGNISCKKPNCCLDNGVRELSLKEKKYLTAKKQDNLQEVVALNFEIVKPDCFYYEPGDIVCIQPRNSTTLCENLAKLMNLDIENYVEIQPNPYYKGMVDMKGLPKIVKIRDLLEKFLDISCYPTRYFFKCMAFFTNDELHKEKLWEMGAGTKAEHVEDYYNYCVKERRNVYEILYDFKSVSLPLEFLVESVNLMKPREYSISSSLKKHPNELVITVALVQYTTGYGRKIEGLCSKYFKSLQTKEKINGWLKKGTLPFPKKPNDPIIMIGPGTGISPFISFLEEREAQISQNKQEISLNPLNTIVIFGCRNKEIDFLYEEYLTKLKKEGIITLFTAFSRDQEHKIYVQHKIKQNKDLFSKILIENQENIKVFISGNAKYMPQQVKESFIESLSEEINNENIAKQLILTLQKRKQFMIEAW